MKKFKGISTQATKPGREFKMEIRPVYDNEKFPGAGRLKGKVALITGADSGIGRAIAVAYAKEGASVAIAYLEEEEDAKETEIACERYGAKCFLFSGDLSTEENCQELAKKVIQRFKKINILVNNCADQESKKDIEDISSKQLESTFRTNFFSYFLLTKWVVPHLSWGDTIINTASVTAFRGSAHLLDYSSTKGAIVAFTRSLSKSLVDKGIRVNGVAPGPVWTPLIPASFDQKEIDQFGKKSPMKRAAQPFEIAPCYVFLASEESVFLTGQFLHPNGGEVINT